MAHIYVRHFGDMFGGSMIKKVIPGSGHMYEFDDKSNLIQEVRSRLNNTLALKVLAGQINFDSNDNWSVAYLG